MHWSSLYRPFHLLRLVVFALAVVLAACFSDAAAPSAEAARHLILYNWAGEIPEQVLETFSAEYGVEIDYRTYDSTEEAVTSLRNGGVYDVVVVENRFVG